MGSDLYMSVDKFITLNLKHNDVEKITPGKWYKINIPQPGKLIMHPDETIEYVAED